MAKVHIRGHSDDILICEGDVYDEFYPPDDKPGYLGFSDGTVIRATYDRDGIWRLVRMAEGSALFTKTEATGASDDDETDLATLNGDIRWVVFGERLERVVDNG